MNKILRATCDTKLKIPFDCLHGIQGNLREMSKEDFVKLRKSLVDNGMNFASHVWKELTPGPEGEALVKWWIIDGHGRKLVIRHLVEEEGYECEDVPCVEIEALSFADAKKKVLLAISGYQKTTEEGLYEFMTGLDMTIDDLKPYELPGVDIPHLSDGYFGNPGAVNTDVPGQGGGDPNGTYKEQYGVIVVCDGEQNQKEIYDQLVADGFNCRVVVT